MSASDASWWRGNKLPTPTSTANHLAPYMLRWPAYARLQRRFGTGGTLPASVAAWMMGLTRGWLISSAEGLISDQQATRGGC